MQCVTLIPSAARNSRKLRSIISRELCSGTDASCVIEPISQDVEWSRHGSDNVFMFPETRAWDAALISRT